MENKIDVKEYRHQIRIIRDDCISCIASFLENTDEDHPLKCDITIGEESAYALSSLEMPHISEMFIDGDSIYMNIDGCLSDVYFIEVLDLLTIVDELQKYHANFANDGE